MMKVLIGVLFIAALGVGAFYYLANKSQNGVAPGLVEGKLAPCPSSPNCKVSEDHADQRHVTAPLALEAWEKIPAAVAATGGVIVSQTDDYIAATYTSEKMKFVDDVEFRKAETLVHVRSASRVGYSDRGANAERLAALRDALAE